MISAKTQAFQRQDIQFCTRGSFVQKWVSYSYNSACDSNTVVKCALGISDTLPTNMFAQAGKLKIETIVFACDTNLLL